MLKDKLAAFVLGLFLAWVGLPAAIHAAYWGAIVAAFGLGYLAHWH